MSRKIPIDLEPTILAKAAATSWSSTKLADWIRTEHGIDVSDRTIRKLFSSTRKDRAEVARAVTREKLTPHVVGDLEMLAAELGHCERLARRLHARAHASLDVMDRVAAGEGKEVDSEELRIAVMTTENIGDLALRASDRVDKMIGRKLHYAGAGEDPAAELPNVREMTDEDLERITSLAERPRRGASRA